MDLHPGSEVATTIDSTRIESHYFLPEASARDRWIALAVFALTCAFLSVFCDYTNLNGDEGIILQGAQRIVTGQVLYRDFFAFYAPGSYYSTALLFRIFGSSLIVARAALVLTGGIFSVLTYLLARRVCSRWSALLAVYASALTCLPFRFLVTHWDSTLCAGLALYSLVLWTEKSHWAWPLATGCLAAFTCLFEQAKGFGLILGLVAGIAIVLWRADNGHHFRSCDLWISGAGFAVPWVATISYFAAVHGLKEMLWDCAWPAFHYLTTNKTPYGYMVSSSNGAALWSSGWGMRIVLLLFAGPFVTIPLLPIVGAGIFFYFLINRRRDNRSMQAWTHWILVSAVLSGLLFGTLLTGRPDFTHLDYLAPIFYLVLAWAVDGLKPRSLFWTRLMPFVAFYVFISSTIFGIAMTIGPLNARQKAHTVRGAIKTADPGNSLEYVAARVSPGEKVFIYPYQPLYYFLTGTFSPTPFDFLQPGMNTADQFQESLRALATDKTPVVLFEISSAEKLVWTSPDTPLGILAARDPLQGYIFQHYRICSPPITDQYWRFLFMVRKDLPCRNSKNGTQ